MKRQKFVGVVASVPLTLALLAGCGSGDEPKASEATTPTSEGGVIGGGGNTENGNTEAAPPAEEGNSSSTTAPEAGEDQPDINIEPEQEATSSAPSSSPAPTDGPSPVVPSENPSANGNGNGGNVPSTGPTPPPGDSGGSGGGNSTPGPQEPPYTNIGHSDGTVLYVDVVSESKIYSSPSATSKVIGKAKSGGSFKGTVTTNGEWIKVDRSPGYVHASNLTVDRVVD